MRPVVASRLAIWSVVIAMLVLGLKYLAFRLTGSVALYSDALESIINVVAALAALIALRVAQQPADAEHPFGHSKAEYFSAVIEGVLVVLAAITIAREAYLGWTVPKAPVFSVLGLGINALASLVNGLWAWNLTEHGKRWRSPALMADGVHLRSDVVSSIGVLLGVVLASLTGWVWLDPALALLVALNVLWSGWQLVRDSVSGLMDASVAPDLLERIRALISEHAQGALEAHDLRTRQAGAMTFVEFHLIVPGQMSVHDAHEICDRIEGALRQELEPVSVTIHVEPEGKAKSRGVTVL